MAGTFIFDKARNAFLSPSASAGGGVAIDWLTATINCVLIHNSAGGTSYNPTSASTDQFFSSVPGASVVAGPIAITSPTAVSGVASCASVVFPGVTGVQVDAVLFYKSTGVAGTSNLICYIDSSSSSGLPVVPNGSQITINIDAGANHLFKL